MCCSKSQRLSSENNLGIGVKSFFLRHKKYFRNRFEKKNKSLFFYLRSFHPIRLHPNPAKYRNIVFSALGDCLQRSENYFWTCILIFIHLRWFHNIFLTAKVLLLLNLVLKSPRNFEPDTRTQNGFHANLF